MKLKVNDHRKLHKDVYHCVPDKIKEIEISDLAFIVQEGQGMLDWMGRPVNEGSWAIWKIVNQLKRISKNFLNYKFKLMPIEIEWQEKINDNEWTFYEMMQVPEFINLDMFEEARLSVEKRYKGTYIPKTSLRSIKQGLCLQKLHVGHYKDYERTLRDLISYADSKGYSIIGNRREIYINQPMCYPTPERWETIIRIQVESE